MIHPRCVVAFNYMFTLARVLVIPCWTVYKPLFAEGIQGHPCFLRKCMYTSQGESVDCLCMQGKCKHIPSDVMPDYAVEVKGAQRMCEYVWQQ